MKTRCLKTTKAPPEAVWWQTTPHQRNRGRGVALLTQSGADEAGSNLVEGDQGSLQDGFLV